MESIGTCNLVLDNNYILDLERTFYIPSFSRNLISVSRLVLLEYSFKFSYCTSICFININLLEMVFCLMVFSLLICNTMWFCILISAISDEL